mgnify:CR=1 FL=1
MLHINEEIRRYRGPLNLRLALTGYFIPEIYMATTLADFVNERHLVKPTRKLLPIGVFHYGAAAIFVKNSVTLQGLNSERPELVDLTSSFHVQLSLAAEKLAFLEEGVRLFEPLIVYHPKHDSARLIDFEERGPASSDRLNRKLGKKKTTEFEMYPVAT